MQLISIQVGLPQVHELESGKKFRTSLFKSPVCESTWLGSENLDGNLQADLKYHGGPDKAVCCYPSEHYPRVRQFLKEDVPYGAFGENFTLSGMTEDTVCLGDQYRLGDAVVEVSQPRQPCNSLVKRWGEKSLPAFMVKQNLTGFYMRVIEEGMVQPGEPIERLARPLPQWTITRLNHLMFVDRVNQPPLREMANCDLLATDWRDAFRHRLKQ